MIRYLLPAATILLTLFLLSRADLRSPAPSEIPEVSAPEPSPPVAPRKKADAAGGEDAAPAAAATPVFFPRARVVARVRDPEDARGRLRVIETVKTRMKEPYVRVERTFQRDGNGVFRRLHGEVAMVANQLLLQKPDGLDGAVFAKLLRQAGAVDVKDIGEATLATFPARPENPRALDVYMSRVREVAGADITVEPNYLRKLY